MDVQKLQAVYESYKSELERRGIIEASTQTDYNKILVEEAKSLIERFPNLRNSIEKILISEYLKHGDEKNLREILHTIGQQINFLLPIAGKSSKPMQLFAKRPTNIIDYQNIVPDTYASHIRF